MQHRSPFSSILSGKQSEPWGFLEGKRESVLPLTVADGRNVGLPVKDKVIQVLRRWQDRGKGAGIVLRHKESLLLKISNPVYAAGEKLCAWQSRKISPDATLWANIARDRWEWGLWFRADYAWVMRMKYEDPRMEAYFNSLPSKVRAFINNSRADISTPGELMLIGEHFRKSFGEPEEGPRGRN